MATLKLYLKKRPLSDGTYPLVLKVLKDGKSSQTHLNINLKKTDWDDKKRFVKKSHPNAVRLNNLLLKKLSEANDKAIEAQTNNQDVSSKAIIKKVKPNSGAYFNKQSDLYLSTLKEAGKYNRYTADKPRINRFKDFVKGDIAFPDITETLLKQFKHHLQTEHEIGERTIVNHFVVIRSVFSQAVKDGAVDAKYYPFGKGKIAIKFPETTKIGLSVEDVQKIETVTLTNPNHNHARNLWLVSFYFCGMRASDVLRLKWSDFSNGYLHYTMGKNLKTGKIPINDKILPVLEQYKEGKRNNDDFVFPDLKVLDDFTDKFYVQRRIAFTVSRMDKFLREHVAPEAGIISRLTLHIARHTFATIAGAKNMPLTMVQSVLRHSNITTTMSYMNALLNKDTDEMLGNVFDFTPEKPTKKNAKNGKKTTSVNHI